MANYIAKGDRVNVYWENVRAEFDVEVIHVPQDVGDCWDLKRKDGTLLSVIFYSKMEQVKQKEVNHEDPPSNA